jgi:6-phosphogluconate dehydrogenase (decarboxylating)
MRGLRRAQRPQRNSSIEAPLDLLSSKPPVLSAALYERFSSRGGVDFSDRVFSAMRKQFGEHDEKKTGKS